ncbi:MAG TPA: CHASE3 domain-containing protein [Pyrinomonadaceae bacterium]|jgi:diguanylate cyclase (GGDEF)-like protein/PAS domain S-box-containing protein
MKWTVEKKIAVGFALVLAILLVVGFVSYRNTRKLIRDSNLVAHSHEVLEELDSTLSAVKDAETGQRGFIITGDEEYLRPYAAALPAIGRHLMRLKELTDDDAGQQRSLADLERKIAERLTLISDSIELRKTSGFDAAERLISTGRGKRMMNDLRALTAEMSARENERLERRRAESAQSARNTTITLAILGALLLGFLPAGFLVIRRDFKKRRRAEEALRESEERSNYLIEHANELIYRTDAGGHLMFVNPACAEILKLPEEKLVGRHYLDLVRPDFREKAEKFYKRQLVKKVPNEYLEVPVVTSEGREVWLGQNTQLVLEEGSIVGFQAIARDITERKRALEELESLSLTDDLTGLYNRRGFLALTEQQLKHARRTDERFVLVFADLDGLKQINDRLGHHEGSRAIVKSAEILRQTFRASDIVARLGGDEFTVLALAPSGDNAETIRTRLEEQIRLFNERRELPYELSISVGIVQLDPHGEPSIEDLLRKADAAMYEHKHAAKEKLKM